MHQNHLKAGVKLSLPIIQFDSYQIEWRAWYSGRVNNELVCTEILMVALVGPTVLYFNRYFAIVSIRYADKMEIQWNCDYFSAITRIKCWSRHMLTFYWGCANCMCMQLLQYQVHLDLHGLQTHRPNCFNRFLSQDYFNIVKSKSAHCYTAKLQPNYGVRWVHPSGPCSLWSGLISVSNLDSNWSGMARSHPLDQIPVVPLLASFYVLEMKWMVMGKTLVEHWTSRHWFIFFF